MSNNTRSHANFLSSAREALESAKQEFHLAVYLGECGSNSGLRKMWSKKADWLSSLIYLAELQLAQEEENDKG